MGEFIGVIGILIVLATIPISIVSMVQKNKRYKWDLEERARMSMQSSSSDGDLTRSELQNLIRQSVTEAMKPVIERLDRIEQSQHQAFIPVESVDETEKSLGKSPIKA